MAIAGNQTIRFVMAMHKGRPTKKIDKRARLIGL